MAKRLKFRDEWPDLEPLESLDGWNETLGMVGNGDLEDLGPAPGVPTLVERFAAFEWIGWDGAGLAPFAVIELERWSDGFMLATGRSRPGPGQWPAGGTRDRRSLGGPVTEGARPRDRMSDGARERIARGGIAITEISAANT